jgi:hypothetical protein
VPGVLHTLPDIAGLHPAGGDAGDLHLRVFAKQVSLQRAEAAADIEYPLVTPDAGPLGDQLELGPFRLFQRETGGLDRLLSERLEALTASSVSPYQAMV